MPPTLNFATLQFSPKKGEYPANLARLGALFAQIEAQEPRIELLHLPRPRSPGISSREECGSWRSRPAGSRRICSAPTSTR